MDIATGFGKSGFQDWVIQRVTAIVLAAYTIFLVAYLIIHSNLTYGEWHSLFSSPWMRYASAISLISLIAHAWIGIWTVTTDYIKPAAIRFPLQVIIILALLGCFLFGMDTLWNFGKS